MQLRIVLDCPQSFLVCSPSPIRSGDHTSADDRCWSGVLLPQDVLWCLVGLMDAEVSLHGRLDCLAPLTGTLVPLLQLLALPENAGLGHILALVTRWV